MSALSPLIGLHHVTAITGDAPANFAFYTRVLGMRLVKKTVNQDDVSAYHLFYGDDLGRPGTELTFFDWPAAPQSARGAGTVSETALRVRGNAETLDFWSRWFDQNNVRHGVIDISDEVFPSLAFQDPEGQSLRLTAEPQADDAADFRRWRGSPVPLDAAIGGLCEVTLSVRQVEPTLRVLTEVLGFRANMTDSSVLEVGDGAPGARLRLLSSPLHGVAGVGGVHHVAWRVADAEHLRAWRKRIAAAGIIVSGLIDRFYFQSIYFRIPGGILFEIATDGPGFTADGEDIDHLGERLSLPPFLEKDRARIEARLKPLITVPASPLPV